MNLLRQIPSGSRRLEEFKDYRQELAKRAIREVLSRVREEIKEGKKAGGGRCYKSDKAF